MKLRNYVVAYSRNGHFDFLHPDTKSIRTMIQLRNGETKKVLEYHEITTEDEVTCWLQDPDYAATMIEGAYERYWSSRKKEGLEFAKYIRENENELRIGLWQQELIHENNKCIAAMMRIDELEDMLEDIGHFENGVWVE